MAKDKTKKAPRPKVTKAKTVAPPQAGRVEVATNLKDLSVGKKSVQVHLETFKVSYKESVQILRWIDQEEPVFITFDGSISAATILTESKVCKDSNMPKLNGLKFSSEQVADLMRILQSESGAVNITIVPDTQGLFQKQMDEEDGLSGE